MSLFNRTPIESIEPGNKVTIDIDSWLKRSNRRILMVLAGLTFVIGAVLLVANSGRLASESGLNALNASFANNARNACITDRKSIQAEAQGEMDAYLIRAVATFHPEDPRIKQVFAQAPLGDFYTEISHGADASIRWATATLRVDPRVLNQPVSKGGCGVPIISAEDLGRANQIKDDLTASSTTTTTTKPASVVAR